MSGGEGSGGELSGDCRAVFDETFHGGGQILPKVESLPFAVLDEGKGHGSKSPSSLGAKKHPVLGTQLRRANGIFDEVVAEFDPPIVEVGVQACPLPEGIGDRFAHQALRQNLGFEFEEDVAETIQKWAGLAGSCGFALRGTGPALAEALFELIELTNEVHEMGGVLLSRFEGFDEASPDVGHAASEFERAATMVLVALVGGVAITLEDASVVFTQECGKDFGSSARRKMVGTYLVHWVVENPEVGGGGPTTTGFEKTDGSFVDL